MLNGKYKPSRAESYGSKLSNQKSLLGFSLNNPRRVPHTGNPQTQTPFRGNAPRGHGGTYTGNIIKSQYVCSDLFNVTHVSVKNNRGMISTKYKWLNRGYPHIVVKDVNPPSYDNYLQKIKGNVIKQSIPASKNCYHSFVQNIGPPSYDTYLNSLKGNIVKNKFTIDSINYNCNCPVKIVKPIDPVIQIDPYIVTFVRGETFITTEYLIGLSTAN